MYRDLEEHIIKSAYTTSEGMSKKKTLLNVNEKKCQSDAAFCLCFQILTQVVIIVTLFLCSVAYWILITDQVNVVQLFIHSVTRYLTKCCSDGKLSPNGLHVVLNHGSVLP